MPAAVAFEASLSALAKALDLYRELGEHMVQSLPVAAVGMRASTSSADSASISAEALALLMAELGSGEVAG